jgi:hypothetical protein
LENAGVISGEVVDGIWASVRLRGGSTRKSLLNEDPRYIELSNDLERHYINAHCVLSQPALVPAARPFRKLKTVVKQRASLFVTQVLRNYLRDEEDFLAHLVRFQNNIAEAHDALVRSHAELQHATQLEFESVRQSMILLERSMEENLARLRNSLPDPAT